MKKIILVIGMVIFGLVLVSAVECGNVPTDGCEVTQNTTFNTGIYDLPNGIDIMGHNIVLNCNGSVIDGTGFGYGIQNREFDNVVINNCVVKNYNHGVFLDWLPNGCPGSGVVGSNILQNSILENNSIGLKILGTNCLGGPLNSGNYVLNNTIKNNGEGINIDRTEITVIYQNEFVNNTNYGVHMTTNAFRNTIYNNSFYQTGIRYVATNDNEYCLDNEFPNTYFDGAIGPFCSCIPLFDGLVVNSNESVCQDSYNLPNGIYMNTDGVSLDCNSSVLIGSGSGNGIFVNGKDNLLIDSCFIRGYGNGISLYWESFGCPSSKSSDFNLIRNSVLENNLATGIKSTGTNCPGGPFNTENNFVNLTVRNNTRGIVVEDTQFLDVSECIVIDSLNEGVLISSSSMDNQIYQNNFVDNAIQASDSGSGNEWYSGDTGNYWNDYDDPSEGCIDSNGDTLCDDPYLNITGSSGSNDSFPFNVQNGWKFGFDLGEIMPVQVIPDVDMVKGKTTLIRIPISFMGVLSNDTIVPEIELYWNNTLVGVNDSTLFLHNETKNVDFWYVPTEAGTGVEIRVEVNGTSGNGIRFFYVSSKDVDVIETREFELSFVTVDGPLNNGFTSTVDLATDFVQRTYPLEDNGISYENLGSLSSSFDGGCGFNQAQSELCLTQLHLKLYGRTIISGTSFPQRIVGIVPDNWFSDNTAYTIAGHSRPPLSSVIIEEGYRSVMAHELGHTYSFCEEYSSSAWSSQNPYFNVLNLLQHGCLNGDIGLMGGQLDASCLDGSTGCDTSTIGKLLPWNNSEEEINLFNFMGSITDQNNRWVSGDTYVDLLDEFSHSTPQFVESRIYINGLFNETSGNYELNNFYSLEEGFAENLTDFLEGNFSIDLRDNGNNSIYNLSFSLNVGFNEEDYTLSNISAFGFVMPFNENITEILFFENGLVKQSVSVSDNPPQVVVTYPNGGGFFNNGVVNISWNAADLDEDNLSYAILLSTDNGGNYTTLTFDHNYTSYLIDTSSLPDCEECLIKILATDGVNTNFSTSSAFGMDNNLNITNLNVVYQDNTERIFKFGINNTLNSTLNNVTWELDTGEDVINSQIDVSLSAGEEARVFFYYNYSSTGNYDVIATARSDTFIEIENISIVV